jgi:hypothetical protein
MFTPAMGMDGWVTCKVVRIKVIKPSTASLNET